MTWYQHNSDTLTFNVYIQPGSKRHEIIGLVHDELKIKLAAPAIDGRANSALIKFLSELLKVPKSRILIKSGEKSRHKRIEICSKLIDFNRLLCIGERADSAK